VAVVGDVTIPALVAPEVLEVVVQAEMVAMVIKVMRALMD
jgi:hypothetical protein